MRSENIMNGVGRRNSFGRFGARRWKRFLGDRRRTFRWDLVFDQIIANILLGRRKILTMKKRKESILNREGSSVVVVWIFSFNNCTFFDNLTSFTKEETVDFSATFYTVKKSHRNIQKGEQLILCIWSSSWVGVGVELASLAECSYIEIWLEECADLLWLVWIVVPLENVFSPQAMILEWRRWS